jgi:hypothetical protein
MEAHRFTSMAMLTGSLVLRFNLFDLRSDEQVFNGASYTDWAFGVPLLQAPFHAVAFHFQRLFPAQFFPDRAIFFAYYCAATPLVWVALDRLLARRGVTGARRVILSWAATLASVSLAIFPLTSCRFLVYEDTIAYLGLAELVGVALYVFAHTNGWHGATVFLLGITAGVGLLIRPSAAPWS